MFFLMDWKSSLEALKADLPQGEEIQQVEAVSTDDAVEKARLDIILDRKGRKGKAATIVAGFTIDDDAVEDVSRRLKQRLGVGGSARGGEILIQGDKRREVADALISMGFKCRVI